MNWLVMLTTLLLIGCSNDTISGPIEVVVIKPTGPNCQFDVRPETLTTVENMTQLRGRLGRVVRAKKSFTKEDLSKNKDKILSDENFEPVDLQFAKTGNRYFPLDYTSLHAASLYYAIETGHLLFRKFGIDLESLVKNISSTPLIQEPIYIQDGILSFDNAAYTFFLKENGEEFNAFFSFPFETDQMQMGLNLGIMVHEFTHFVFQYIVKKTVDTQNITLDGTLATEQTFHSLNEGLADYFGFLSTKDPQFFVCTNPKLTERSLDIPGIFNQTLVDYIAGKNSDSENFDPHVGGAIWAAIQYQIGLKIGFEKNGELLANLMKSLPSCLKSRKDSYDFGTIAQCHLKLNSTSTQSASIQEVYEKYLGKYSLN